MYFVDCIFKTSFFISGTKSQELKEHKQESHSDFVYKCDQCSFASAKQETTKLHVDQSHEAGASIVVQKLSATKDFNSDMNDFDPQQAVKYEEETQLETDQSSVCLCDQCEKTFADESKLKRHIKRVHDELSLSCDMCEFKCKTNYMLDQHKKAGDYINHFYFAENKRGWNCMFMMYDLRL